MKIALIGYGKMLQMLDVQAKQMCVLILVILAL